MKVPKGHAKAVEGICAATPRSAVANLLQALLPRVPIAKRAPDPATMPEPWTPDPLAKLTRKKATRRRPRVLNRDYEVTFRNATGFHRYGTWTWRMVDIALNHNNTKEAETYKEQTYPQLAEKNIDWNWLVGQGYIKFIN